MHFNGPYAIQWAMIQMALEMGFERYNFYGISGNFSEMQMIMAFIYLRKVLVEEWRNVLGILFFRVSI